MGDVTVHILRDIRDEARITNQRLDQVVGRVDQVVERVDQVVERVDQVVERVDRIERHQIEMETRLAAEVVAVAGAVHELRDILLADRDLRTAVADHERRIAVLEQRAR